MKVLYILHTAKPGGAAQSLAVLLNEWRKRGDIQPLLALPRNGPLFAEFQGQGWPVFALPPGIERRPRGAAQAIVALAKVLLQQQALVRIIRREKVAIVHSNATGAHLAGGLAARRCGIPSVWHVRDLAPLGRWGGLLARRADAVVAISRTVAGALQEQNVPRGKIHLIYNTLDIADWPVKAPPDANIRKTLNAAESDVIFGCVGQLVPWKNQGVFIEAAARLRAANPGINAKFAVIGSDPWQENSPYRQGLIQQAAALGLGRDLIFFPHQENNRAALAACDVLVHAALREPFGRVLIEAMALRKTVIAFDAAGPGEILSDQRDGWLVPPEQGSAGLAAAMQKVLLTPALRAQWGQVAHTSVQQHFDAAAGAEKMRLLYEALCLDCS